MLLSQLSIINYNVVVGPSINTRVEFSPLLHEPAQPRDIGEPGQLEAFLLEDSHLAAAIFGMQIFLALLQVHLRIVSQGAETIERLVDVGKDAYAHEHQEGEGQRVVGEEQRDGNAADAEKDDEVAREEEPAHVAVGVVDEIVGIVAQLQVDAVEALVELTRQESDVQEEKSEAYI